MGLEDVVGPGWADALDHVRGDVKRMGDLLRAERAAGRQFLPRPDRIFAAFAAPFDEVRVLLVGQDPYPTPGHPIGLCFAVAPDVNPLPGSLENIFREYCDDLGCRRPRTGDLSSWVGQGVMLLNRCLTVQPHRPASHRGKGWESVTEAAIRALAARDRPLVAILWGRHAQEAKPWLRGYPVIQAPHPSPLSAHKGFFGSRPFTRVNHLLEEEGAEPVDWRLS